MKRIAAACLCALVFWVFPPAASALQITPGKDGLCLATLSGVIDKGDADKLTDMQMEAPEGWPNPEDGRWKTLCLDSPGGSYTEGFAIARHLLDNNIGTVVDDGDKCLSACALVFMFGTAYQTESNALTHRRLHVGGKLGFHQPDLRLDEARDYSVADVRAAFEVAIDSTLRFLALAARPRPDNRRPFVESDLQEAMLSHKGQDFYMIDTVNKAGRWGIELFGFEEPAFSELGFFFACQNMVTWPAKLAGEQVPWGRNDYDYSLRQTQWTAGGLTRERYDLQIAQMQTYDCAATVAQHWSGRILPMLCGYREDTNSGAGPDDCTAPDRLYSWAPIPPQAMFPAATSLDALANGTATEDMPKPEPLPNPCVSEREMARVINVKNYTSLRQSTTHDSDKLDELRKGSEWPVSRSPAVNPDHFRHETCLQLCQLAEQEQPYDRVVLGECIADNWMWFEITGPSGKTGYASAKFLDY